MRPFELRLDQSFEQLANDIHEQKTMFLTKQYFDKQMEMYIPRVQAECKKNIKEVHKIAEEVSRKIDELIESVGGLFAKMTSYSLQPVNVGSIERWSSKMMHVDLKLKGNIVICHNKTKRGDGQKFWPALCLGRVELNESTKVPYCCAWKVISQSCSLMFFGIVRTTQAISHNFGGWDWTQGIGHGVYSVGATKHVFSNTDASINYKQIGFKFGVGDTIQMEYDPTERQLTFRKSTEKFKMNVEFVKGDTWRMCAWLYNPEEVIEMTHSAIVLNID